MAILLATLDGIGSEKQRIRFFRADEPPQAGAYSGERSHIAYDIFRAITSPLRSRWYSVGQIRVSQTV